jgi:MFS family permease
LEAIPLAGHLSDRFDRKRIYLIGSVAAGIFGFIYFAMLNTMVPAWIFRGIVLSFVPPALMTAYVALVGVPAAETSPAPIAWHCAELRPENGQRGAQCAGDRAAYLVAGTRRCVRPAGARG